MRTLVAVTTISAAALALPAQADNELIRRFDVVEDQTRFVFAPEPVHEDGMPAYGNPFIARGYIYPVGTLDGASGIEADGDPTFPDGVIGTWACIGWFVADGAHTRDGEWLVSKQTYVFAEGRARKVLVSQGPEFVDVGEPFRRPITGAPGPTPASRPKSARPCSASTNMVT